MPDLSFREKSILGSLVATVVIYGYYFSRIIDELASGREIDAAGLALMGIGLLVLLIIVELVYHAVIALLFIEDAEEPNDERDILISAKASRNGGYILAASVITITGRIFIGTLIGPEASITPFMIANLMLFALVLAQVFESLSELFYYRWGV